MLVNRNITVGRLRTSVRLEPQFWDALSEIAARERVSVDRLCTIIDANTGELGRTAAIRVFIASYFAQVQARAQQAIAEQKTATFDRTAPFQPGYTPISRAI